jgi:cyclomaltodextrinase
MSRRRNSGVIIHFWQFTLLFFLLISSCRGIEPPSVRTEPSLQPAASMVTHPDWSYNLSIYEVNLRQYSPQGEFEGFEKHLPRLQELGAGILWFMPVHPIGEVKRKGSLGSYYSVRDYYGVNPEFGTLEEFKTLVDKIHQMGMYVIIDWVANHSAWDNPLTVEHPDWYMRDSRGNFFPPVPDWSDVIGLNYSNPELREYMVEAMKFWASEVGIDGFRCDVAGMVPLDFWDTVRSELEEIKPVFMLAEAEGPSYHRKAFDMTYGWEFYHLMNAIAQGRKTADDIGRHLELEERRFSHDAYRMYFTSNHDENSWNGTVFERLGKAAEIFAVLTATMPGMPLVYSGQEAGLDRRLEFFEKDFIEWKDHQFAGLYTVLINLKAENQALWNGDWGGPLVRVHTSVDEAVFSFIREKDEDGVFVVLNLSDREQLVAFQGEAFIGNYLDLFAERRVAFSEGAQLVLEPWEYGVYVR